MSPKISVAVCTHDRYALLAECLAGLARQTLPAEQFEVVVVDNTPDAVRSTAEAARHAGRSLRWLHQPVPGLSNARNAATHAAAAPLIAFIDDDAVAEPDWLEEMLAAWSLLGDGFAAIGGRVLPRFAAPRPAWLHDGLLGYLSVVDMGETTRGLVPPEWVAGASISYRVEALRDAGGFNPALGRVGPGIALMSNDETELADRLAARGHAVGYAGRAVVRHLVEPARLTQSWLRRRIAWQAVSDYLRDAPAQNARSGEAWASLKRYLAEQPAHERSLRALALPQTDGGAFAWQMAAVYDAVTSLLSGVADNDV